MLNFEDCKKTLNKNNEQYSDEQIKQITSLLQHWARLNAMIILKKIKNIEDEEGSNNG